MPRSKKAGGPSVPKEKAPAPEAKAKAPKGKADGPSPKARAVGAALLARVEALEAKLSRGKAGPKGKAEATEAKAPKGKARKGKAGGRA